ncbi:histidine kinase [Aquimarina rubra]|uniref:Histidine kinase n=1 Tax=Aquimarina rubra TaxID=1920033 RepID=A0ABW5LH02_9FLAO
MSENYAYLSRVLFFGWTLGAIFLLSTITFLIFLKVREKSFLYYSLYAIFLNIYIAFQAMTLIHESRIIYGVPLTSLINWPVQFVYYLLYTQFIRTFFNFKKHNPKLDKLIVQFIWGMGIICLGFTLLNFFVLHTPTRSISYNFEKFILFFYIPFFVPFAAYVLYKILKSNDPAKHFIIIGSTVYVLSALTSMYFSVTKKIDFPLIFFMIGVLIEFIFFAVGLGIKVYLIFEQRNEYQEKLIDQLETNKKLVEYNNQILTDRIENFTKKEIELEFKNSINKLKSKVFRSQVNSHFIFNILNSIKASIISNNKEKSIDHLNKFSKLIRNILNHSLEEYVSLEKEIEITKLYVLLENLRFENQIHFTLKIDPNITSTSSIKIPPFILQPFVENSIWHGLANKKGKKSIKINISQYQKKLKITIQDNGIGMLKALEIQKKKSITHKSLGIDITKERLILFAQDSIQDYNLVFENLGTENNSKGTKVLIEIPLKNTIVVS